MGNASLVKLNIHYLLIGRCQVNSIVKDIAKKRKKELTTSEGLPIKFNDPGVFYLN